MFSPQTDDSTLQELKKYYDAVMPMTNPAMYHNPHTPAAENQRGKLNQNESACYPLGYSSSFLPSKQAFSMTKYMKMAARDNIQ